MRFTACCELIVLDLLKQWGGGASPQGKYNAINNHTSWQGKILTTQETGFFPNDAVKPCPCVSMYICMTCIIILMLLISICVKYIQYIGDQKFRIIMIIKCV